MIFLKVFKKTLGSIYNTNSTMDVTLSAFKF